MAVEAAKQAVLRGLADFDREFSSLESQLPSLQYNDIVKRLNALIAQLQPLSAHFNTIGPFIFLFSFLTLERWHKNKGRC